MLIFFCCGFVMAEWHPRIRACASCLQLSVELEVCECLKRLEAASLSMFQTQYHSNILMFSWARHKMITFPELLRTCNIRIDRAEDDIPVVSDSTVPGYAVSMPGDMSLSSITVVDYSRPPSPKSPMVLLNAGSQNADHAGVSRR
ncbi:MAG: hypothetical protein V4534_01345 [Myxococcota bacterium]